MGFLSIQKTEQNLQHDTKMSSEYGNWNQKGKYVCGYTGQKEQNTNILTNMAKNVKKKLYWLSEANPESHLCLAVDILVCAVNRIKLKIPSTKLYL